MPKQVTVSAEWLAATGHGDGSLPRTFNVLSERNYGPGRRMFYVDLDGREWCVWEIRLIFAGALWRFNRQHVEV